MLGFIAEFIEGLVIGTAARNARLAARDAAIAAERAAWPRPRGSPTRPSMRSAKSHLAGQRRFVLILFAIILAIGWLIQAVAGH